MDLLTYFKRADIEGFNDVLDTMLFEDIMSYLNVVETNNMDNKHSFLTFSYIALSTNPHTASKFEDYVVDRIIGHNTCISPSRYAVLFKIGKAIFKDKFNKSDDITRMRFAIRTSEDVDVICDILKRMPETQHDASDVRMPIQWIKYSTDQDKAEHVINKFIKKIFTVVTPSKEFTNEIVSYAYFNHWRMNSDLDLICSILEYCVSVEAGIATQKLFDFIKRQNNGLQTYPDIIKETRSDLWRALIDLDVL